MGYDNQIKTINMDGLSNFDRIDTNLRSLIASMAGTIPGSRGFGLSVEVIDQPPEVSQNLFAAELDEKVMKYMPEIRIADIEWNHDSGVMSMNIYIEANDEYEEGDEEE